MSTNKKVLGMSGLICALKRQINLHAMILFIFLLTIYCAIIIINEQKTGS